jgi:hypothetical protein
MQMAIAQALHQSRFAPRLSGVMLARSLPLFFVLQALYAQRERLLLFHVLRARNATALETNFQPLSIAMQDTIAPVVVQLPQKSSAMPGITVLSDQKLRFRVKLVHITLMWGSQQPPIVKLALWVKHALHAQLLPLMRLTSVAKLATSALTIPTKFFAPKGTTV